MSLKDHRAAGAAAAALVAALLGARVLRGVETVEAPPVTRVSDDVVELSPDAQKNIAVAPARRSALAERLSVMGRVSATEDRVTSVSARVSGRVSAAMVASGESVTAGQPLASLFSPDFAAAREEYLQALKQPRSADPRAGADRTDLAALARKRLEIMGLAPEDVAALASLTSEQSSSLLVRAPASGVLLDKRVVVGNVVNAGDTLFTVGNLDKVWFVGDIYPEDLAKVRKNQEVVVEPSGLDRKVLGTVSFISPVIDPTTRTIKIRALMDNPDALLRADMYVRGGLVLGRRSAVLVPAAAVISVNDDRYAFVAAGARRFRKVKVQAGLEQDGRVEVLSGIKDGDRVVTEGALLLEAALDVRGTP